MTNVIYGVTFLPFSATHAEFQLEAKDYASGSPVKIVVKDHDGEDICQGNIAKGSMISGDRHVIEFVKIGRAKRNGTIMSGECRDEAAPIESARLSGS